MATDKENFKLQIQGEDPQSSDNSLDLSSGKIALLWENNVSNAVMGIPTISTKLKPDSFQKKDKYSPHDQLGGARRDKALR